MIRAQFPMADSAVCCGRRNGLSLRSFVQRCIDLFIHFAFTYMD